MLAVCCGTSHELRKSCHEAIAWWILKSALVATRPPVAIPHAKTMTVWGRGCNARGHTPGLGVWVCLSRQLQAGGGQKVLTFAAELNRFALAVAHRWPQSLV